jgi:hypothetical protein
LFSMDRFRERTLRPLRIPTCGYADGQKDAAARKSGYMLLLCCSFCCQLSPYAATL